MQARPTLGRVAILTGAAGGIGTAMTKALLAAGHSVAAVDRDATGLRRLAAGCTDPGLTDRFHPVVADLESEAECRQAVDIAVGRFGRVEAVINNAGIGMSSIRPDAEARHPGLEELTAPIWDRFFAINVRAPMLVTQTALPLMKAQGWGRIINNTTSFLSMLRVLPYGATKAALEAMSAVWAAELAGSGITVNVLIPGGPTDTPLIAKESGWPRDRMLRPEIMGPPLCWLLSEEADDVNSQRITAARWDAAMPGHEAASRAGRAIGWLELTGDAVWLTAKSG